MKIFSMTDVGRKREMNQDYVFATDESLGTLPNLLVVADGMGGHKAGDFASKYTVEVLKEELKHTLKDGGINEEEARHHPDKNIITRAIGVKEDVEADFYEFSLKKGDIILMCSDGLSNMIEDEEIFAIVKGARDIVEAGQNLIDRANENGGNDNISVVLAEPFSDEVSIW